MQFLRHLAGKFGIDKAIFYTSSARVIQAAGGIVSILLVARYLTGVEQGFYYTFGSIVAIQVFFELGLNGIITQYVAHEIAHLQWKDDATLIGDQKYKSRLSSLLHFCVKWYIYFAILLLITLMVVGYVFFTRYQVVNEDITWKLPWLLLAIGTAFNLLLAPILAFIEGLGKVKEVAKIRLWQQSIGLLVVWGSLMGGAKLYTPGINWIIGIFLVMGLIYYSDFKVILVNIWRIKLTELVNYRKEIFPYQWKIALSWISGYFIFQLFNPVLFATEGAVVAGQMGMTLAALNGVQALSLSWMTTKIPVFSGFIAQKQYQQLDSLFNRTLKQSVFINICALAFLYLIIFMIKYYRLEIGGTYLGSRFLDYIPLLFMVIAMIVNQFVNSWAIYLRCHKKEPFLVNSVMGGVACCLSTIFLGKFYGVIGITSGYCLITLSLFGWGYWIYKTKKHEWHRI